jgi:formylglycine-generating enzyme required for sulfatase activity
MSKIFISYARADDPDRLLCEQIESFLKPRFEVWFDKGILAGEEWWSKIEQRLEWCEGFFCLVSPKWLKSICCQKEYDIAFYKRKKIIPFLIKEIPEDLMERRWPETLKSVNYANLVNKIDDNDFSTEAALQIIHAADKTIQRGMVGHRATLSVPPTLAWCEIPTGDVTLTYDTGDQETYSVPAFRIGKYPITNRQYQTFVNNGYKFRVWWHFSDDAYEWRLAHPEPGKIEEENRPFVNASWYDAVAFCKWLSEEARLKINLPSELQWQRAAQGDDNHKYPWGNEFDANRCNTIESNIEQSTSVKRYNTGVSPYGVYDMAGNVWEWCINPHRRVTDTSVNTSEPRILRGGSWGSHSEEARVMSRMSKSPDHCSDRVGFRIVCSTIKS